MTDSPRLDLDLFLEETLPLTYGTPPPIVIDALQAALGATALLKLRTHAAHWTVTGPLFESLHTMFNEQYTELDEATDETAERLRALEARPATRIGELLARSEGVVADSGLPADAAGLVEAIRADNAALALHWRVLGQEADRAGDVATVDLAGRRAGAHEKAEWKLRATTGSPV